MMYFVSCLTYENCFSQKINLMIFVHLAALDNIKRVFSIKKLKLKQHFHILFYRYSNEYAISGIGINLFGEKYSLKYFF